MKTTRKNKLMLGIIAICLLSNSCSKSFLERTPPGALDESLLANKKGVGVLLIGVYGALDGQDFVDGDMVNLAGGSGYAVSPDNWIYGSVCGGDAHKGSDAGDSPATLAIARFATDANNGYFSDKWRVDYEGIARANTVLRVLEKVTDMTDDEKKEAAAEARFLRGHYYFDLHKMFDKVPWIDEHATDYKATNDQEILTLIEEDLKFAMDNLHETQEEVGRPNKWAGASYLAKVLMYHHNYQGAKPIFDQIITQGVNAKGERYELVPFENNFDAATENNSESVFSIQYDAMDNSGTSANANQGNMLNYPYNGPFSCCGFYQPTFDLVNSFVTNDKGLPYLDTYNTHDPFAETVDPRLDWTVGRLGIPYLDWGNHPGAVWSREESSAGPFSAKKNVYWQATQDKYYDPRGWAPGNAINYNLIRYADVLLLAAECEAQLLNLDKAEEYVNTVRTRAANPAGWVHTYIDASQPMKGFTNTPAAPYKVAPYPNGNFTTGGKDYALKAIYFERKLELAMEGHRFFDLVRWGIADKALNAFFQYEGSHTTDIKGAHFTKGTNEYFPIPQRQIDLTTKGGVNTLTQNPGYH